MWDGHACKMETAKFSLSTKQAFCNNSWLQGQDNCNVKDGCKQPRSFITTLSVIKGRDCITFLVGDRKLDIVIYNIDIKVSK